MNESISRSAGAQHGQELPPEAMEELIRSTGRVPRQRTTLYGEVADERRLASFGAVPLAEPWNPPVKDAQLSAPPRLVRPGYSKFIDESARMKRKIDPPTAAGTAAFSSP
jgi:hypothetical protein